MKMIAEHAIAADLLLYQSPKLVFLPDPKRPLFLPPKPLPPPPLRPPPPLPPPLPLSPNLPLPPRPPKSPPRPRLPKSPPRPRPLPPPPPLLGPPPASSMNKERPFKSDPLNSIALESASLSLKST
eukprot:c25239_g1_i1 orf=443-820(+)